MAWQVEAAQGMAGQGREPIYLFSWARRGWAGRGNAWSGRAWNQERQSNKDIESTAGLGEASRVRARHGRSRQGTIKTDMA